jgi:hypothetical protein
MEILNIEQIKNLYPDEWILVGNPIIENTKLLEGIVLYHSKDKKEVCYLGRGLTEGFSKITLAFTGSIKSVRKMGVMRRLSA